MQVALEAAQQANIRVATLLETTVANPEHRQTGVEADPRTVQTWISDIVRSYGSHPAYLRVGDRPVIFVYSVPRLRVAQWEQVVAGVRASACCFRSRRRLGGRDELERVVGEHSHRAERELRRLLRPAHEGVGRPLSGGHGAVALCVPGSCAHMDPVDTP